MTLEGTDVRESILETLKPLAIKDKWLWAGNDLSESATVSEESIAVRILSDLAPLFANVVIDEEEITRIGVRLRIAQTRNPTRSIGSSRADAAAPSGTSRCTLPAAVADILATLAAVRA